MNCLLPNLNHLDSVDYNSISNFSPNECQQIGNDYLCVRMEAVSRGLCQTNCHL